MLPKGNIGQNKNKTSYNKNNKFRKYKYTLSKETIQKGPHRRNFLSGISDSQRYLLNLHFNDN